MIIGSGLVGYDSASIQTIDSIIKKFLETFQGQLHDALSNLYCKVISVVWHLQS